jgi:hypothetical protein
MEDFVEFVKTIKRKVHDWWMSFESRHLWTARLIVYFTCLAGVVLVCFILFRNFNLFHTDADSARYMLSALVQSQAAIVAIVITLTLIAVQLTASAYSPRLVPFLFRLSFVFLWRIGLGHSRLLHCFHICWMLSTS